MLGWGKGQDWAVRLLSSMPLACSSFVQYIIMCDMFIVQLFMQWQYRFIVVFFFCLGCEEIISGWMCKKGTYIIIRNMPVQFVLVARTKILSGTYSFPQICEWANYPHGLLLPAQLNFRHTNNRACRDMAGRPRLLLQILFFLVWPPSCSFVLPQVSLRLSKLSWAFSVYLWLTK